MASFRANVGNVSFEPLVGVVVALYNLSLLEERSAFKVGHLRRPPPLKLCLVCKCLLYMGVS